MKIRGVQFAPKLGDVGANLEFHRKEIEKAAREKIDLVVFPELSLTGYQLKDIVYDLAMTLDHPALKKIESLSRKAAVIVGAPVEDPGGVIYNCALCYAGGKLLHLHRKTQLPNYGMFEEKMLFRGGDRFHTFRLKECTIGLLVCREILFPVHGYLYFLQGVDLLIGISNSPFRGIGKSGANSNLIWESMGYVYSTFHHLNYLFVNRCGFEEGLGFGGGSFFAPAGKGIQARAKFFEEGRLDVDATPAAARRARIAGNYLRDEHPRLIQRELERILHDRD